MLQQHTRGHHDRPSQESSHDAEQEEYDIYVLERKWVFRCRNAALVALATWLVWIVVVQVLAIGLLPGFFFVRRSDQADYTGW